MSKKNYKLICGLSGHDSLFKFEYYNNKKMNDSELLGCKITVTVITIAVLAFGLSNIVKFKSQITSVLPTKFFYVFGIISLVLTIAQIWTPVK